MSTIHTSRWETAHVGSPVLVQVDEFIDTSGGPDTGSTTRTVAVQVDADMSITEARRLRDDLAHAIALAASTEEA